MGILGNIAKRKTSKAGGPDLYKKRDKTLNKAIASGKVSGKQIKALETVRTQKDTKPKASVKKPGLIGTLKKRKEKINKMNKGY